MKTFAQAVFDKVSTFAPIRGVGIVRKDAPDTWQIDFDDAATDEQRNAALAFMYRMQPDDVLKSLEVMQQIADLEAQITPRRLRESRMGVDNGWLEEQDNKIEALKTQLS